MWSRFGQYRLVARAAGGFWGCFPSLIKRSRERKPLFFWHSTWLWDGLGCLGKGRLGTVALAPCSPASRIFHRVRRCVFLFKLGFSSAAPSVLAYHPDALLPPRGLSLSLIDSGNSSFRQRSILKDPPLHGILRAQIREASHGPGPCLAIWLVSSV